MTVFETVSFLRSLGLKANPFSSSFDHDTVYIDISFLRGLRVQKERMLPSSEPPVSKVKESFKYHQGSITTQFLYKSEESIEEDMKHFGCSSSEEFKPTIGHFKLNEAIEFAQWIYPNDNFEGLIETGSLL